MVLPLGLNRKGHLIAQTFVNVCSNVSVGRGPFGVHRLVEVLVYIFPNGVVAEVAGNFSRLNLKGGGCEFGRGFDLKFVLTACGYKHETQHDRDCNNHDAGHGENDTSGESLARRAWISLN